MFYRSTKIPINTYTMMKNQSSKKWKIHTQWWKPKILKIRINKMWEYCSMHPYPRLSNFIVKNLPSLSSLHSMLLSHVSFYLSLSPSLLLALSTTPTSHYTGAAWVKTENTYIFSYNLSTESVNQSCMTWKLSNQSGVVCLLILFFQTKYWHFTYIER